MLTSHVVWKVAWPRALRSAAGRLSALRSALRADVSVPDELVKVCMIRSMKRCSCRCRPFRLHAIAHCFIVWVQGVGDGYAAIIVCVCGYAYWT